MNAKYEKIMLVIPAFIVAIYTAGYCSQKDSVYKSYNLLSTIAGKGSVGDGVVNCWEPSFEGKPAIEAALSGPHMAMADSMGNVYIADKDAHAIRKVDCNGIITTVAGINRADDGKDGKAIQQGLNSPNGLWVNKKGEFYVLDLGNSKVRKVDSTGSMKTIFKEYSTMVGGRGLWVNSTEDTIWYSNMTEVKMWVASEGSTVFANGFTDLGNICRDHDGHIIATDRGAHRVYRLSKTGEKTPIAGNGQQKGSGNGVPALEIALNGVRGVWFCEDKSYFLATHEGSQVWWVDSENVAYLFINGKEGDDVHKGDGENFQTSGTKVSEVRAVTVDYQGNVLITENDRGYIRKVSKANVSVIRKATRFSVPNAGYNVAQVNDFTIVTLQSPGREKVNARLVNQLGQVITIPMIYTGNQGSCEIRWENSRIPHGIYTVIFANNRIIWTERVLYTR